MTETVTNAKGKKRPRTLQDSFAEREMHDWGLNEQPTWEEMEGLPPLPSAPVAPVATEKPAKPLDLNKHVPGQVDMGALPPHRGGVKREAKSTDRLV